MKNLRHVQLVSNIEKKSVFGRYNTLPKEKQLRKHVIGDCDQIHDVEDKFFDEIKLYVESLNDGCKRSKLERYMCNSYLTYEYPIYLSKDKMLYPIEIHL